MPDLRARDLRNDLGRMLGRVQASERLRGTLRGRPIADLVPVPSRPATMHWSAFWVALSTSRADPGLQNELRQALPGDTDDVKIA